MRNQNGNHTKGDDLFEDQSHGSDRDYGLSFDNNHDGEQGNSRNTGGSVGRATFGTGYGIVGDSGPNRGNSTGYNPGYGYGFGLSYGRDLGNYGYSDYESNPGLRNYSTNYSTRSRALQGREDNGDIDSDQSNPHPGSHLSNNLNYGRGDSDDRGNNWFLPS